MAEHRRVASTVAQAPAVEQPAASRGAAPSNEARRQGLPVAEDALPPLDDVFWEGFAEEHVGLVGDIALVTGRASELQPQVASPALARALDRHIDGIFALDEALAAAITAAHAGAHYGEGDALELDVAAMDTVVDLWERLDVALDLLREHNALCAALVAADLAGMMSRLSTVAQLVIQSGMERSMAEAGKEMEAKLAAFQDSWKVAALSVAKLPADVGVDVAVGAAITAAVPLIPTAAGLVGTLAAVGAAAGIAYVAGAAWNSMSEGMGPKPGVLHEQIGKLNGMLDVAADATAIERVGDGLRRGAEQAGKISLGITVLLDLVATGVAIEGIYAAAADWEAFKKEDARLRELWGQCAFLFGGFVRLAERTRSVTTVLAADIGGHEQAIADLDELYGEGLYAV